MTRLALLLVALLQRSSLVLSAPRPIPVPSPAPDAGAGSLPAGFATVAFHEDFSGLSDGAPPSSSRWKLDIGTSYPGGPSSWGTGEKQSYTSSADNLAVVAGNLVITPVRTPQGRWTSARIETVPAYDFACAPGQTLRMEAKLRLGDAPAAQQLGIWPAFWALGADFRGNYGNWPAVGEIDVLESPSGAAKTWQTIHCGTASGGPCREPSGLSSVSALTRGDWHVVAVEINRATSTGAQGDWKSESISWFVDGRKTFTVSGRIVGDADAWAALAHAKHFLLLNVAVGGSLPDSLVKSQGVTTPTGATVDGAGVAMEVEYVGVYTT